MATSNLTTPGVYIQELNSFPPSVAPVSTAIPAFVGYTEKGPSAPTRITSMLEYVASFGGAYDELYTATLDANGDFSSVATTGSSVSPYTLYYHMEMYFGNGGGPCYVISVGNYSSTETLTATDFYDSGNPSKGIGQAREIDEVTLLVVPEAIELSSSADTRSIYDAMLDQCNDLKDRFSIFDVKVQNTSNPNPVSDGNLFRNSTVSANFLDYGSAYYPPLDTILHRSYSADDLIIDDSASGNAVYSEPNNRLATVLQGVGTFQQVKKPASVTDGDSFDITIGSVSVTFTAGVDFASTPQPSVDQIVDVINSNSLIAPLARAQKSSTAGNFYIVVRQATSSTSTSTLDVGIGTGFTLVGPLTAGVDNSVNTALGVAIKNALAADVLTLGASATMAGIYASVDNDRGVWKAPANVSVANIIGPSVPVTEAQQGSLNVDAVGGKSINVIRSFTGRGTLVWGARTLDGNSNEWRYVPVRRLFIMAEESIKKACEFVVFEPNDKNTWLRVKALASNFLTDLWKQGALAGAKPEQAFFVQVGLGETMTAQDILEGKMIVRIGMAAVRPAEFIILQFVQQLQQS